MRSSPSTSASQLGTNRVGVLGEVIDGPVTVGGTEWWKVDFEGSLEGWSISTQLKPAYFPPAETAGGWRSLVKLNATPSSSQKSTIKTRTDLDWNKLKLAYDYSRGFDSASTMLVIRNGWIAGEWGSRSVIAAASISKTLTGLVLGTLFDRLEMDPDGFAYPYLPAEWSASEPRKLAIRIDHLMTMTSGLEPDDMPTQPNYAAVLLGLPVRADPDTEWSYASSSVDLLGFAAEGVAGKLVGDVFNERIAAPLGIPKVAWSSAEGHSRSSSGASMTARDLARVAQLMLMNGIWDSGSGQLAVLSKSSLTLLRSGPPCIQTAAFQGTSGSPFAVDPNAPDFYGHLLWTNRNHLGLGAAVPTDSFYSHGLREKLLIVVPSHNMIVIRLGTAPTNVPDFRIQLMKRVMAAVTAAPATIQAQQVASLSLIDADTDQPIAKCDPLPPNAVIRLASLPTSNIAIRANTSPATVGSVRFALDGDASFRTETAPPYALFGDTSGNYTPWPAPPGQRRLVVTPFTRAGGNGTAGLPLTSVFTIETDGPTPPASSR